MNIYQKLKQIHPDLAYIKFDGEDVVLTFDDGRRAYTMIGNEFKLESETRKIILLIEDFFDEEID